MLGALHVAAARLLDAKEFFTTDLRQARLAKTVDLLVVNPARKNKG